MYSNTRDTRTSSAIYRHRLPFCRCESDRDSNVLVLVLGYVYCTVQLWDSNPVPVRYVPIFYTLVLDLVHVLYCTDDLRLQAPGISDVFTLATPGIYTPPPWPPGLRFGFTDQRTTPGPGSGPANFWRSGKPISWPTRAVRQASDKPFVCNCM